MAHYRGPGGKATAKKATVATAGQRTKKHPGMRKPTSGKPVRKKGVKPKKVRMYVPPHLRKKKADADEATKGMDGGAAAAYKAAMKPTSDTTKKTGTVGVKAAPKATPKPKTTRVPADPPAPPPDDAEEDEEGEPSYDWSQLVGDLRALKGWSLEKMAEALEVSTPTIRAWEQGKSTPSEGNQTLILSYVRRSKKLDLKDYEDWA